MTAYTHPGNLHAILLPPDDRISRLDYPYLSSGTPMYVRMDARKSNRGDLWFCDEKHFETGAAELLVQAITGDWLAGGLYHIVV